MAVAISGQVPRRRPGAFDDQPERQHQVRLLANYTSRKVGTPGTRQGTLIGQAQVKF